jgi:hypothetical protein
LVEAPVSLLRRDPERESLARRRVAAAHLAAEGTPGVVGDVARRIVDVRRFTLRASGAAARRVSGLVAARPGSGEAPAGSSASARASTGSTGRPARLGAGDELELAVGPVLDDLRPDVIEVRDARLARVAGRVAVRAARAGRPVPAVRRVVPPSAPADRVPAEPVETPILDRASAGSGSLATPPAGQLATPPAGQAEAEAFLAIGPANSAGQAWAWARAAERNLPGVRASVVAIRNGRYDYPADEPVDRDRYLRDAGWQARRLADARSLWTHVLLEAGRPILGGLAGRDFVGDAGLLAASGVRVGLVMHGSEVRDPRRHAGRDEFSPFTDPRDELTRVLQSRVDALLPLVGEFIAGGGPVFVSTPDQLDDVPAATWLPVVVDPAAWPVRGDTLRWDVPLFVHAPSNPRLKGTAHVERVLRPLADRGLIEFRLLTGLPPSEAAELISAADVVVDQLVLGLYGVLACEAMAAGRVVIGHLGDTLRGRVAVSVPVLEATPTTLAEVVQRVLDDRDWARSRAAEGPGFVTRVHDGRRSAEVLADFLGRRMASAGSPGPGAEPLEVPGP